MRMSLLVVLFGLTLTPSLQATDHIVIVFDTSSSMDVNMRKVGQSRMKVGKDALKAVMAKVPPSTNVGLLTFNGWSYDLQPIKVNEINDKIDNIWASGGTPLYEYVVLGANRLLVERQKANNIGSYKLIVITDGEANGDDQPINKDSKFPDGSFRPGAVKDIISRGIIIDAIGVEMSEAHSLKNDINGIYMSGSDQTTIEQSLSKSVAEVGFNTNDKTTKEAFETIAYLPDGFARNVIGGLTEFRNHPIRTQAPKTPVETDKASYTPPESMSVGKIILIVLGTIFCIFLLLLAFAIILNKDGRRY